MPDQKPSVGRIVHYRLSATDVEQITRRRTTGKAIADRIQQQIVTLDHSTVPQWPLGAQAHIGNPVSVGAVIPLLIIVVWPNEHGPDFDGVNGQAFLDGNDVLWVTSVKEGTEPGTWAWPPRV